MEIILDEDELKIHKFEEATPLSHISYFSESDCQLFVGIVFYNENSIELRRILVSLADALSHVTIVHKVLLVGDGYSAMQSDMKVYLEKLFCSNNVEKKTWTNLLNDMRTAQEDSTYILKKDSMVNVYGAKDGKERKLDVSLLLKVRNRRKHNSQQWILQSFIKSSFSPENCFVLLSDCGTTFESRCISKLVEYMRENPSCGGSTGRQRVMDKREQDEKNERVCSWSNVFRQIQKADYESTYVISTAAASLVGFLPVLPGPCALFRYSSLLAERTFDISNDPLETQSMQKESVLDHFTNIIDSKDTNIVLENIKLAEDRIPSYALLTHGYKDVYTTWVQGAVFHFQAETQLTSWIAQRRRWINGAFMCYVWNLFEHPEYVSESKHSKVKKFFIFSVLFLSFLNYLFSSLSLGIFGATVYIALLTLCPTSLLAPFFLIYYTILLATFAIIHHYRKYNPSLFPLLILTNSLGVATIVSAYIYRRILYDFVPSNSTDFLISLIVIVIFSLPFVMACVALDWKSMYHLLFSYIPYILFLPTLVGGFTLYSFARLSDISWGNRASDIKVEKEKLNNGAITVLSLVLFGNLLLLMVTVVNYQNSYFITTLMLTLLFPMTVQVIMSFIYFMYLKLQWVITIIKLLIKNAQ